MPRPKKVQTVVEAWMKRWMARGTLSDLRRVVSRLLYGICPVVRLPGGRDQVVVMIDREVYEWVTRGGSLEESILMAAWFEYRARMRAIGVELKTWTDSDHYRILKAATESRARGDTWTPEMGDGDLGEVQCRNW